MKVFKQIDLGLQIAFFAAGVLLLLMRHSFQLGDNFFTFYLILGAWQTISVIVHFFFPAAIKYRLRTIYHILLLLTIAGGIITGILMETDMLEYMYYMLFWTPILALLYITTCAIETSRLNKA